MFAQPHEHVQVRELLFARPSALTALKPQEQSYQSHFQLGNQLKQSGNPFGAQAEYQQAIAELERLRSQLSIDRRSDFLMDKQHVYEEMVNLCIDIQQPAQALAYAEMTKSRTLYDLLAMQIDAHEQLANPADWPWFTALRHLRQTRDQLVNTWQELGEAGIRGAMHLRFRQPAIQQAVAEFEQRITTLWHGLLADNSHYMRHISSAPILPETVQAHLSDDAALVEYFVIQDQFVAFVVTKEQVRVFRLPATVAQVRRLLDFLQLNLKAVVHSTPEQIKFLTHNATQLLQRLSNLLFRPLQQMLKPYAQLIIVPHGVLHQLPFHALHDGSSYLIEQYAISYLPRATLLRYCQQTHPAKRTGRQTHAVALGYSAGGQLPYAVQEAQQVAQLIGGQAFLEETATKAHLRTLAEDCRILHLATHGHFRDDNPLFSGLALADGWLTTLDAFDLDLHASLITLSACQTGCHVVGGGDELRGLIRAFLATGTATLVAGLWAVEDQATACLMELFYKKLADGWNKHEALRHAQLCLLKGCAADEQQASLRYRHPYFWAPFFLMGDTSKL
ncbi:MAG: CHAT domain-containing protein [Caldilineaceae bacterium]